MQIFCSVSGAAGKRRMFRRLRRGLVVSSWLETCSFFRYSREFWWNSGPESKGGIVCA